MTRILAIFAILFAFAAPSAMAKNDYSCDKKFIFFHHNYQLILITL
jgi:hypothetical protein